MSLWNPKTVRRHSKLAVLLAVLSLLVIAFLAIPASKFPPLAIFAGSDREPVRHVIPNNVSVIDGHLNYLQVRPGDQLLIQAGNRGPLKIRNLKGTPDAPIVIMNYGGQVQIGTRAGTSISIDNSQYIRLTGTGDPNIQYGFDLSGFTNSGLFAQKGTEEIEIDHLEIHHPGDGKAAGIRAHSTVEQVGAGWIQHNTYIHHCYIHDVGSSAMYIGKADSQGGTLLHGVEIAYNRAERCGMDGYQVRNASQGCRVHHNYAEDIGWRMLENPGQQGAGLAIESGSSGQWHDNVIINANTGAEIVHHLPGLELYNNLFVHCGYVNDGGAIRQFTMEPVSIHHNTIVESNNYGIKTKTSETAGEIRDNIIAQSGQVHISSSVTQHHNLTANDVREIRFVNPAARDYRLREDSPARGAGTGGGDLGAFPYRQLFRVFYPLVEHDGPWPR